MLFWRKKNKDSKPTEEQLVYISDLQRWGLIDKNIDINKLTRESAEDIIRNSTNATVSLVA